ETSAQHETFAARRERRYQVAQHGTQTGEALEGAELEELVEKKGGRRQARRARRVEERQHGVERVAGRCFARRGVLVGRTGERRRGANRLEKALRRRRDSLGVDVLR